MTIDGVPVVSNSAHCVRSLCGGYRVAMRIEPKGNGKPRFMQCETPQTDYLVMVVKTERHAKHAVEQLNAASRGGMIKDYASDTLIGLCWMPEKRNTEKVA